MSEQFTSGRIIGVFGIPCTGKSTIIKTIIESSRDLIAHISTGDIVRQIMSDEENNHMADGNLFPDEEKLLSEVEKLIYKRRSQGCEIIILDGLPRHRDQVKWMLDNQFAGTFVEGRLIQISADVEVIIKRAEERMRNDQDELRALLKKMNNQTRLIDDMESLIFHFAIPYYSLVNHDLEKTVADFAKIIGLRK